MKRAASSAASSCSEAASRGPSTSGISATSAGGDVSVNALGNVTASGGTGIIALQTSGGVTNAAVTVDTASGKTIR